MKNTEEYKNTGRNNNLSVDDRFNLNSSNIKELSIRGGAITLTTQVISQCITVASVVILARLLTPEDYGTVAMVTAITGIVTLFRELGLSGATVQSKTITHDQISTLFWINVGLGTLITLIIAASGPFIARFYDKPELIWVTVGISFTSLFSCLGTQHGALLRRHMRFKAIAVIQISALFAGFVTAVFVALSGGTYWALVANTVVAALCNSAGLWIASDFRPGLPSRSADIRKFIHFGVSVVGFDIAYYFRDNVDKILIGRVWGAHQLGLYSKAFSLLALPIQNLRYPLGRVAFPAMSRLQNEPERFRGYFIKYCSFLAFASMPLVSILYLCSENIIRVFLGEQWLGAIELFRILAIAGFIQTVATLRTTVIMASGHSKRLWRWGLYNAASTVIAFIFGLPWGAKGMAIAYCIVNYVMLHPMLLYAVKDTPVRPVDFYRSIVYPFLASITMCALYLLVLADFLKMSDIIVLSIAVPSCAIIYLAIFYLLPGGKQRFKDYREYVGIMFRRSSQAKP